MHILFRVTVVVPGIIGIARLYVLDRVVLVSDNGTFDTRLLRYDQQYVAETSSLRCRLSWNQYGLESSSYGIDSLGVTLNFRIILHSGGA